MKEIFFLRHGETVLPHRYVGKSDIDLSEKGRKQISLLVPFAHSHLFSHVYCSPLRRCVQSAELIGFASNVEYDRHLCEIDFGLWEGQTFAEIEATSPEMVSMWCRNELDFCFPEGEKMVDFYRRIESFAKKIQTLDDGKILIIAHGGVIRHLICTFLNLSFNNYLCFQIDCGKVSVLKLYSEGGILTQLNGGIADV